MPPSIDAPLGTAQITIRGARQHNLKNIDLVLPRNRLIVITGLSGSGKSSLAFDTLYAEGQRRYVESLSTYARQFLERLDKPDVDLIEGLSPAIAIEQKSAGHNPRSTVGTVTEVYDYLRLLYARVGVPYCPRCQRPIRSQSLDEMIAGILALPEGSRIQLLAPLRRDASDDGGLRQIKRLRKQGFARIKVGEKVCDIESVTLPLEDPKAALAVVVDRLVVAERIRKRLADSLELALSMADGQVQVERLDAHGAVETVLVLSEQAVCHLCGAGFPPLTPASFSFNSPHGACPRCNGLGTTTAFDPRRIVPDADLSLREGAVAPWAHRNSVHFAEFLEALTAAYGVDVHTPYRLLPEGFKKVLLHGSGKREISFSFEGSGGIYRHSRPFEGVIPSLQRRYLETTSAQSREEIETYMTFLPCPACGGSRLNEISRNVRFQDLTIAEVTAMTVERAIAFFEGLTISGREADIARPILSEIVARLEFLRRVGLGYLTVDRSAATLSGGESQRIRLATQIGSRLTGVLYVLDEPSIGLHPRDHRRLLDALCRMRDIGNTVLVVEHDADTIKRADHVVDMGPGAGDAGGTVIFSGPPQGLLNAKNSLTGQYLGGQRRIEIPPVRRRGSGHQLVIREASGNNLKQVTVGFPLGCFIGVTGVSGSGKSTLVLETLYPLLARRISGSRAMAAANGGIEGLEHVDRVIHVDQSPIGRTPRSNPGTYTGIFQHIRELFARTQEARMRGYRAGRFSFNVKGGRCEACGGDGIVRIEMHFLPDVYVTCDVCQGRRYNRETLDIRYKGKNIAEVLDMTVEQALSFFSRIQAIREKLETLMAVGIGYIRLGQPATTLSGGEAQRIKLARELSRRSIGHTVYILDEPTTGLHVDDVRQLLEVLQRLVDAGNTVVVIEHHLDVIKSADHLIDLGPEGGEAGGQVVATGTPEQVAAHASSHTGRFLRGVLAPA
ncbi:MAG: excinuclease ABC subunit UvrA [Desulfobacterales bacterium]|jgi:excinuclease ABC subunit A|nr:excinuclease ABC subunit UvrA [Desulfobacteraceae bacterium]MDY0310851.1 excinuclease ABC subunit UvrA [Desulfobacterales bacterium]